MLKYEIICFTIKFPKDLEKVRKSKQSNLIYDTNSVEYINCKNTLEEMYDDIAQGIKVRSKCRWYKEGEKATKFFLNLEKTKATQGTVKR